MVAGALALITGVILFCTGLVGRSPHANLLREPGPPHLRGARNPQQARGAGRRTAPGSTRQPRMKLRAVILDYGNVICRPPTAQQMSQAAALLRNHRR